ncbi:hypothetical protein ACFX11_025333 [Malus domestica]
MVREQVWPPRLTHVAARLNNSVNKGGKSWNSTPKEGQGGPSLSLSLSPTKPYVSPTQLMSGNMGKPHLDPMHVKNTQKRKVPTCEEALATKKQKTLLLDNQLSPTLVQETKLSRSVGLPTYAYAYARGRPNLCWGQVDGIDNAALKGVENPIILQGTGGWPDAATGDK